MISIIHPSRSRPQKAFARRNEWVTNAVTQVEYILSLDTDDNYLEQYRELFTEDTIIVSPNRSLVDATNRAARMATGDIFVVVSDDFFCFPGWDAVILKAVEGQTDFMLKTYDGIQEWIVTLPILDRAYFERVGYIYNPNYRHLFADTHQTHLADMEKRLIIRNDIVFSHRPHYREKVRPDDISRRSDGTQAQGERAYREQIRQWMHHGYDVFNLSPEAKNHIVWIKQRIK